MSDRHDPSSQETIVPWGIVFIAIGILVLLTVGAIVLLSYSQKPNEPSVLDIFPTREYASIIVSTRNASLDIAPTPDNSNEIPILMPETPLDSAKFPSFASVDEAPQIIYYEPKPGQPVRLMIPALNIDAQVQPVSLQMLAYNDETFYQWEVPAGYEAGWHGSSAMLGEPGNTVINGHNNTLGEIFRDLADLEIGDTIMLYDIEREYQYQIDRIELLPEQGQPIELRLENAKWIEPTTDERITLVSCWPYVGNTHRIVVVARPMP
ncbi:MAG: sortase [Chloroflexi bacterium]|nr:sortase [Chloroflexota bacterium]MBP8055454.1 sortase [Chloroflexota bacterium]